MEHTTEANALVVRARAGDAQATEELLARALAELPARQRLALALRYVHDLSDVGLGLVASDFRDHALIVLGPGAMQHADAHGHVPLFGVTARSVTAVALTYASGPPLRVDGVAGGFVLLAEPGRGPREVVGYDAAGQVVERARVDESDHPGPRIDWSRYDG